MSGYTPGQCTAYVASLAPWVLQYGNLGNANTWASRAMASGAKLSSTPYPGAVAVWGANQGGAFSDGHVALVTGVQSNGLPTVSEMNWTSGPFRADTRAVPASSASGIVGYILPPNTAMATSSVQNATAATGGALPSSSAVAGKTSGGWSVGPFQVLSGHALVRIGYTLAGLGLIGFGVWVLFRKEVDGAVRGVVGAVPKVVPA
ncbi:MAG TPA: CHAP domain-containing protein [Solirubrobacteraceae bacterium]|nr:CHAP domain-containing protein [Solirubrobacteraceae bacterium]